jgi:hypothetical protein
MEHPRCVYMHYRHDTKYLKVLNTCTLLVDVIYYNKFVLGIPVLRPSPISMYVARCNHQTQTRVLENDMHSLPLYNGSVNNHHQWVVR